MSRRGIIQLRREEYPEAQDMGPQQHIRQNDRQRIREHLLGIRGVLAGECNRRGEFMMLFVDLGVQHGVVKCPVDIVEGNFPKGHAPAELHATSQYLRLPNNNPQYYHTPAR